MEKPRALRIATNPRPRIDLRQLHYLVAIADAGANIDTMRLCGNTA